MYTLGKISRLQRDEMKRIRSKNHIAFLKRCKKNSLIPSGFTIKNRWGDHKKNVFILERAAFQIMNVTIEKHFQALKQQDKSIIKNTSELSLLLQQSMLLKMKELLQI